MKHIISFSTICILSLQLLCAQTTRGLGSATDEKPKAEGKAYALIVGISKYQNKDIPLLQYPDKDAAAFYEYLKAGGIDTNNVTLLLNDKAKGTDFWLGLDYFLGITKPGDKLYLYFAGHGDVESRTITRDAYLLPYDAPKVAYASGAISIYALKGYLATFSSNGVQVVFISDACHAGNLAGGRAGMDATATFLKDKWEDEIKILSCQPGEFSLEGKQWGGGRGLFSYELINGLAGKADKNKDGKVTLRELDLYLTEKVPEAASPGQQNPMVDGKRETILSNTNEQVLERINHNSASTALALVDMRGFDDVLLKGADINIKNNYAAFKTCMDTGNYAMYPNEQLQAYAFGQPTDKMTMLPSALYYLKQIPLNDTTRVLLAYMRRNLAAALMSELTDTGGTAVKKLGQGQNSNLILQQMSNYLKAIQLKSIAIQQLLGIDKLRKLGFYSKLVATEVYVASTDTAHFNLAYNLALLDTAISFDPNNAILYYYKGYALAGSDKDKEAITEFKKAIELAPKLTIAYSLIAACFKELNQTDSLVFYSRLSIQNETDNPLPARLTYIALLSQTGPKDSLNAYLNTIEKYIPASTPEMLLGNYYVLLSRYARDGYLKDQVVYFANKISDNAFGVFVMTKYALLASAYDDAKDTATALKYFTIALEKGYNDFNRIMTNEHMINTRQTPEFKTIMKKYFPTQYKD